MILGVLRRIGEPARVRATPFGRDCPGDSTCLYADADELNHRCVLGSGSALKPVFRDTNWIITS